jgi:DNA (cytosine-5)-methyltransferase 1
MTLRLLDTFSGIGGFSYAAERIVGGFETVAFVEREPYCQQILSKHWPSVPIYDDITTFNPQPYSADVVCGGFPCQDISTAGKQAASKKALGLASFTNSSESFAWYSPNTSCWKTSQRSLLTDWTPFSESWPKQGLMRNGRAYRQVLWATAIKEIGGGLLPTPYASFGMSSRTEQTADRETPQSGQRSKLGRSDCLDAANTTSPRLEGPQPTWRATRQLYPNWKGYISEPVLCRGDDGLSGRVDRLKALGNAVVPQVAAIPLARVRQLAGV